MKQPQIKTLLCILAVSLPLFAGMPAFSETVRIGEPILGGPTKPRVQTPPAAFQRSTATPPPTVSPANTRAVDAPAPKPKSPVPQAPGTPAAAKEVELHDILELPDSLMSPQREYPSGQSEEKPLQPIAPASIKSTASPPTAPSPQEPTAKQVIPRKIVINVPSRTLWVYEGEKIVKWYPVGVGRPGFPTPLGKHKVLRKIIEPGWEHPYKGKGEVRIAPGTASNPLGTRWIGFKEEKGGEYGIHGTDRPSSVGKYSSHGCVRMHIKDAEDLFERVEVNDPVEVTYDTALIRRDKDSIRVLVYPDHLKQGTPTLSQLKQKILQQYPGAQINEIALSTALKQASEKPAPVATIIDSVPREGQAAAK